MHTHIHTFRCTCKCIMEYYICVDKLTHVWIFYSIFTFTFNNSFLNSNKQSLCVFLKWNIIICLPMCVNFISHSIHSNTPCLLRSKNFLVLAFCKQRSGFSSLWRRLHGLDTRNLFFIVRKEGATYLKQKYTLLNNCLISVQLPIPWFLSMFYSMSRKQTGILPKSFLDRHLSAKAGEKKKRLLHRMKPHLSTSLGN